MAQTINREKEVELISSGTLTEAIVGGGAIALTILALLNVLPLVFLAIATIAAGAGLFFQGSTIAAEYTNLIDYAGGHDLHRMNIGGGISMEIVAGGAGIALGILALLGLVPHILLPVAAIVLGCAVALSSTTISRLNNLKIMHAGVDPQAQKIAGGAVDAASGAQILIGLGAAVLGILSLVGAGAGMILTTVAILGLGFTTFITGLALSGRAFRAF